MLAAQHPDVILMLEIEWRQVENQQECLECQSKAMELVLGNNSNSNLMLHLVTSIQI